MDVEYYRQIDISVTACLCWQGVCLLELQRPKKKNLLSHIIQRRMMNLRTSSTQGRPKNSLRLRSSCLTVIPSVGPLPRMVSRSRDCDSNQVCINVAGSLANDSKNVRLIYELCNDCARREIYAKLV